MMEQKSGETLTLRTGNRRKHGVSSNTMEPILTRACLKVLQNAKVIVQSVGHDEHRAVTRVIKEFENHDGSKNINQLEVWHKVKNLTKHITEDLSKTVENGPKPLSVDVLLTTGLTSLITKLSGVDGSSTHERRCKADMF